MMQILKRILHVRYGIILCALIFALSTQPAKAQQSKIKGTVVDEKGEPIPAATIQVKGKQLFAVTDDKGAFSIAAKPGDLLEISSVSFSRAEIKVTDAASYKITLSAVTASMSDVVVVGYGHSSKQTLSSAITSIKPEDMNKGAIGDVGQLLQGKVPGLNITASGDPNGTAAVVLRGASTINSPQGPFYVIDGIPGGDISAIAPDDIASIDVLKDAAATAIYGNKASNGVIMVTTKKGRAGKPQTSYNGYVGEEKVTSNLKLMNATQLRDYVKKNGNTLSTNDDLEANTDWMKAIEKPQAISYNNNISFSGGSDKSTYSASLNYLNKDGVLLASSMRRVIARLSLEHLALNDKLKLGLNITNASTTNNNVPLQNVVLQQAAIHLPVSPVYNTDGSYFENFNTPGYFNPVSLIKNAQNQTKYNALQGNFTAEAKLPFGFKYNLNLAYQKNTSLHGEYYDSYYSDHYNSGFYTNPDPGFSGKYLITFGTGGQAYRSSYTNASTTVESYLTWDKKINKHSINAVVGYSWQNNTTGDGLQASNTNFVSDYTGYQNLALGNYLAVNGYTVDYGSTVYQQTKFISDFARLNYNYAEKYLVQASLRRDGSSVFGPNNQWGYFPAVSLGWRIKQEKFMQDVHFVNDLKLRASYGQTGNAFGFGAYTAQLLFTKQGTYYNNGVQASAVGVSQGSNPDLKWEITGTKNIGLDFALFKNKVSGSVDWYEKLTTDMIFGYTVSSTIVPGGFVYGNGGKVRNRGLEINLSATPVMTKTFNWTTTFNFAFNKNMILDLHGPSKYGVNSDSIVYTYPEGAGQSGSSVQILKVGHPIGQFFAYKYAGKDADGNSQFMKHDGTLTTSPTIGTDYFYIGDPNPKLLYGWSNTVSYKNFDLSVFVRGVYGNKIFNASRANLSYTQGAAVNNIVQSAADDLMTDGKNNYYSSRYVESGSYLRLDNATLGYRVQLKNNYISSLRFYITGNNLFVITKYTGIDPEINQGGVALGVDNSNFYPKTRTLMFGVNVQF